MNMENTSVIDTFIEIEPLDSDVFLKVKETLTRVGIASRKTGEVPTLWQSCHIFHKRGRYYIVHFKQMFLLDGKQSRTVVTEDDLNRVIVIANLLSTWGLVTLKQATKQIDQASVNLVIISHASKSGWSLKSKYSIGKKVNDGNQTDTRKSY